MNSLGSGELPYTGIDTLDTLKDAKNYNSRLTHLIARHTGKTRSLIDFGAGIGTFAESLRDLSYKIVCIEPDPGLAERLMKAGFETHENLASIADNSAKFIFSLNVLEHISDDHQAIREVVRKLVPGGSLFLYVPAFRFLWSSLDDKVQHYRRYTKRSLSELVEASGMQVTAVRYADCLGLIATLMFKLMGNKDGNLAPGKVKIYDRFLVPTSQMLDHIFDRSFGKNVWIFCHKL